MGTQNLVSWDNQNFPEIEGKEMTFKEVKVLLYYFEHIGYVQKQ